MRIDLYHLRRHLHFTTLAHPIVLEALRVWADSIGWDVRLSSCGEAKVDLTTDAQVVGFSVYTQTAPAVYRLAEKLRDKGKIVILGGPHLRGSATHSEASPYCDVIVSSISEKQWKGLLIRLADGRIRSNLQKPLHITDRENQFRYPNRFYEACGGKKWYQFPSVPTSIGCPYDCSFCNPYMHGKYILRGIETIRDEVARIRGKTLFLCDATFGLNKRFTIDLMRALAPLEKKILVETTLARLRDGEILDALALGGVKWITVGIESITQRFEKHGPANPVECIKGIIEHAHNRQMLVQGNLICGMDSDGPEAFDRIDQFCRNSDLDLVMLPVLTPYPNTRLFHRLQKEGRIFDTNWEHYDYRHLVYRPARMTVDQFIDGYLQLCRSVTGGWSVWKKILQLFWDYGVTGESAAAVGFWVGSMIGTRIKQEAFRKNQGEIRRDFHVPKAFPDWENRVG